MMHIDVSGIAKLLSLMTAGELLLVSAFVNTLGQSAEYKGGSLIDFDGGHDKDLIQNLVNQYLFRGIFLNDLRMDQTHKRAKVYTGGFRKFG